LTLIHAGDAVVSVSDTARTDDVTVQVAVSAWRHHPRVTSPILARLNGVQRWTRSTSGHASL